MEWRQAGADLLVRPCRADPGGAAGRHHRPRRQRPPPLTRCRLVAQAGSANRRSMVTVVPSSGGDQPHVAVRVHQQRAASPVHRRSPVPPGAEVPYRDPDQADTDLDAHPHLRTAGPLRVLDGVVHRLGRGEQEILQHVRVDVQVAQCAAGRPDASSRPRWVRTGTPTRRPGGRPARSGSAGAAGDHGRVADGFDRRSRRDGAISAGRVGDAAAVDRRRVAAIAAAGYGRGPGGWPPGSGRSARPRRTASPGSRRRPGSGPPRWPPRRHGRRAPAPAAPGSPGPRAACAPGRSRPAPASSRRSGPGRAVPVDLVEACRPSVTARTRQPCPVSSRVRYARMSALSSATRIRPRPARPWPAGRRSGSVTCVVRFGEPTHRRLDGGAGASPRPSTAGAGRPRCGAPPTRAAPR